IKGTSSVSGVTASIALARRRSPMPSSFDLLRCVGQAAAKNGLKALLSLVPGGEFLFEVSRDSFDAWNTLKQKEGDRRAELQALARPPDSEVRRQAEQLAGEIAAGRPAEERQALAAYLMQVPATVRRALRRPADPSGTTIPANLPLRKADDL